MGYWKSKVLPKIKKVFEKNPKKAAAAEASKAFDGSKEEINKEVEAKKAELQPKVIEIYEASSEEVKTVVKERKEAGIKKNAGAVQTFIDELVKIEFPGSKKVSEASTQFGAALVPGPVIFLFEQVTALAIKEEPSPAAAAEEATKEKEVVAEEAAPEEKQEVVAEEKKEEVAPAEEVVVLAAPPAEAEAPKA